MWPPIYNLPLPEVKSFIGVIFAVTGNILISVALNVQKYAHNELEELQLSKLRSASYSTNATRSHRPTSDRYEALLNPETDDYLYLHSKAWWLGVLLMLTGEVGNFIAYAFAPASLVAPLGTVALISNVILAPMMLKETFRKQDLLGVAIAIIGAIVVVINSKTDEVKLDPVAIIAAMSKTNSLIYFGITIFTIVCLMSVSDKIGPHFILVDLSLVALFGGYTVLSTKAISSMLTMTFVLMFEAWITWFLLFVLIVTAVAQIKYLNKALQRFDSTQVIPTQFVLFTMSAIIGSALLYNDFAEMGFLKGLYFLAGCLSTFIGVYFITSNRNKSVLGVRPPLSRVGSLSIDPFHHVRPDSHGIYDEADDLEHRYTPYALYVGQRARATSIPRRQSMYSHAAHSSTPLLSSEYNQHDSLLRSMIHGRFSTSSLTAGVSQALNSVGARHSHALGLDQVFENYLLKMEEEQNANSRNDTDANHRRSLSVPPLNASRRGLPKSPTTSSCLSTSYTNSSYYDETSGYNTDSVNTDDDETRTISGLTTSSANSSQLELYSSNDAESTYDAFPELSYLQNPDDLPDLPYRRDTSRSGRGGDGGGGGELSESEREE
ncbi:6731_t:CDS:2 [Ambispora gerdemannii]|uniref:6731_t:CDS:1 n=1 Tax=Ambispora gerdemannii TaxID=144530 RepID=A0A9N8YMF7_9GLOM|nr:6731_t:CDS:2 [Ambispora gerdemannii]